MNLIYTYSFIPISDFHKFRIIVCRKKTYGKNIKSLQFAGYPKDISNLNRKRFKSSDFYGEHLVKDDYYTNGICEDGYSNVTKKKNNQVLSVGYSPYIKFDQKSLIAFKKEKQTQITKAEPRQTQKVAKVEEPKQEEIKSKSTNQDKDPPVIQIASNITVSDTTYEIEGVVKDNSENIFVEIPSFFCFKNWQEGEKKSCGMISEHDTSSRFVLQQLRRTPPVFKLGNNNKCG